MEISLVQAKPIILEFVKCATSARKDYVYLELLGNTLKLSSFPPKYESSSDGKNILEDCWIIKVIPCGGGMYISDCIKISNQKSSEEIADELLKSLENSRSQSYGP